MLFYVVVFQKGLFRDLPRLVSARFRTGEENFSLIFVPAVYLKDLMQHLSVFRESFESGTLSSGAEAGKTSDPMGRLTRSRRGFRSQKPWSIPPERMSRIRLPLGHLLADSKVPLMAYSTK